MKTGLLLVGMALLGLGGAMALTNPTQAGYEAYATAKLTEYLSQNTCAEAGMLKDGCNQLIRENQSEIKEIIAANTQRENFLFLSRYSTELSVSELLPPFLSGLVPSYHFETVGIFNGFHVVEAKKR
jgi:hypothetical protein